MPVEYRTGDLFTTEAMAIGHGCNTQGHMGAGIALVFKRKYPLMFRQYHEACVANVYQPGDVMVYQEPIMKKLIFNMMTQPKPGATAKVEYIRTALKNSIWRCEKNKIEALAIPRIGAGLGGLDWEDVKKVVEELGNKTSVRILVYTLPDS